MRVKVLRGFGLPGGASALPGDLVELPDAVARVKIATGKVAPAEPSGPAAGLPVDVNGTPALDTRSRGSPPFAGESDAGDAATDGDATDDATDHDGDATDDATDHDGGADGDATGKRRAGRKRA